jgi:phosphate transport system permease protein
MNRVKWRKYKSIVWQVIASFAALIGVFWLVYILGEVFYQGVSALNFDLFFEDPLPPGSDGGGLRNAFVGQIMVTLTAATIGIPIGVLAGTFLAEYARNTKLANIISALADVLVSVPSIVIGIFVYSILVKPFGHFSGWSGAVALAIIMIPVVLRTTQEMLGLVDYRLREAAFALGSPYYKVIWHVVYPAAVSGILTGVLLSIARVGGETAPLLFTAFNNSFYSTDMSGPIATLNTAIYKYAGSSYAEWHTQAWAASLVIAAFNLILSIAGRYFVSSRHKRKKA